MTKTSMRGAVAVQLLPGEERRRSQRVMIRVPVTLEYMVAGKKVKIEAITASVNDHGEMLLCTRGVNADLTMDIINERTLEKLSCRVTRAPVEGAGGYLIPIEFLTPSPGFWRISFPPTDWKPVEN